ncbi:MAG: hypothetical protein CMH62_03710 [Nanoarchaeota archaeon]|nr:hypothetical protein [Nanoarchaeota archaeon]
MKAIFFTDVHLVSKTNVNRVDNLPETQKLKLKELIDVCSEDVDIALSSGDMFDRHTPAITTMNTFTNFAECLNIPFILCPGNHDLHGYNYKTLETTGLGYTCKLLKTYKKIKLFKQNDEYMDYDNFRIHFKQTIDKEPMKEFIVDRTTNEFHLGLIHDMVYNIDFYNAVTTYDDFNTNLDVVFNGHIHNGHEPIYLDDTWFINTGSVTRMHKPKPVFIPRYAMCNLKGEKKHWVVENKEFKCAIEDTFNVIEKRNFNDFISNIESKNIQTNALDYMFKKAKISLTETSFNKLNELYDEVR